jgi:Ser/Thr protein kinase RdoA (MazF antagonist)
VAARADRRPGLRLSRVGRGLPWGAIHGDAHTGNLLAAPDGRAILCDLDSVAKGPREWDLVPAASCTLGGSTLDPLAGLGSRMSVGHADRQPIPVVATSKIATTCEWH